MIFSAAFGGGGVFFTSLHAGRTRIARIQPRRGHGLYAEASGRIPLFVEDGCAIGPTYGTEEHFWQSPETLGNCHSRRLDRNEGMAVPRSHRDREFVYCIRSTNYPFGTKRLPWFKVDETLSGPLGKALTLRFSVPFTPFPSLHPFPLFRQENEYG